MLSPSAPLFEKRLGPLGALCMKNKACRAVTSSEYNQANDARSVFGLYPQQIGA